MCHLGARRLNIMTLGRSVRSLLCVSVVAAIDVAELEKHEVSGDTVESWCVEEQAMEVDISQLQQVEDLERKVISASLQVKVQTNRHPTLPFSLPVQAWMGSCVLTLSFVTKCCCDDHISQHLRQGWMHPEPQSERDDLVYHEHKLFSSSAPEKTGQSETSQEELPGTMVRRPNNPLDIAVIRLAELERNIERRC